MNLGGTAYSISTVRIEDETIDHWFDRHKEAVNGCAR